MMNLPNSLAWKVLRKSGEAIKSQLESQNGEMTRMKVKRALLDQLDELYDFELPPTLVNQEFDGVWRQVEADLQASGKTFEDEETTEEKAREEYRKIAERRVRLGLLLSEIGNKNNIKVEENEVQRALIDQARQYPGQERQVIEFYQKNPQQLASLRAPIFEDKVIDYLLELVTVEDKTVSKEELMKQDEDDKVADAA
jgi:trigger factor